MLAPLLAAGAVSACALGYQTMAPTGQWFGRTFTGLPRATKRLALTYDDGPNDPYTWRMMDVLERHGVNATFFLLGRFVQEKPEIARALVAAGHAIGSHTWDHPNLIFASSAETRRQLQLTQQAILDASGVHTTIFRPPFGGRRPASLRIARELGMEPVMWNVTCYDWKAKSADDIAAYAGRQIRGGDVILLHDGEYHRIGVDRSRSVEATDRILSRYRAEGFDFVTIPQMMARPD